MNIDYELIGKRIREYRTRMGITQQVLAELSSQEPSNVSHIERGATKLSLPTLIKIANALGVSADELLCDNLEKSKDIYENEITLEVKDCTEKEIRIISETIKTLKSALRKSL